MTPFGLRLKKARKIKNITQKELAETLGVEQSTISNYEKGLRHPAATALMEIAQILEVSVEFLLGGAEDAISKPRSTYTQKLSGASIEAPDVHILKSIQTQFISLLLEWRNDEAYALIKIPEVEAYGLFNIYHMIFEPTLKAVGEMWQQGKVSIAEEHVISGLIERLIMSISESNKLLPTEEKPFKAAFMLPSGEQHEIPLKLTAELFKSAGWSVSYIGKSIPLYSLETFLESKQIDVLVISITLKDHLNSAESLIRAIRNMNLSHNPLIIVGGSAIENDETAIQQLGADFHISSLHSLIKRIPEFEKSNQFS
jgi:MerR family transcriptional regulator, light-induced transcriptional regulator